MDSIVLSPNAQLAALAVGGVFAGLAVWIGVRLWTKKRISSEEREQLRRAELVARGKITDATLVEISDNVLFYSYLVRGVEYTATQDVGSLRSFMPVELSGLGACPVSVRYEAHNPANSIVLAEKWSGLHARRTSLT